MKPMSFKALYSLAIVALATSTLTACSSNNEVPAATTTAQSSQPSSTIVQPMKPDEWTSLDDIGKSINQINAGCASIIEDEGIGACGNPNYGYYTFALNTSEYPGISGEHRLSTAFSEREHDEVAFFGSYWSIHCFGDEAVQDCTNLEEEFGSDGWVDLPPGDVHTLLDDLGVGDSDLDANSEEALTSSFSDGTHLVGTDIQPGTYRNGGSAERCYWARLSGLSGDSSEILANDLPRGQAYVEILPTDRAFESKRCGSWELIE